MSHITNLSMVILLQADFDAAVAFYKKLGLKAKFELKNKWAEFEAAGIKIGLCPTSEPITDKRTGIVFEVLDLVKSYQELKDFVEFLGKPHEAIHGIMVSFRDPGGNIIDLYQPTPEKIRELIKKTAQNSDSDSCCKSQSVDEQEFSCCKTKENSDVNNYN